MNMYIRRRLEHLKTKEVKGLDSLEVGASPRLVSTPLGFRMERKQTSFEYLRAAQTLK